MNVSNHGIAVFGSFRLIKPAILLTILLPVFADAYHCRTDFGLIEIPDIPGFVPGDNVVKKVIQRTKVAIGGHNGKVSCVLVREEELGQTASYSEMFSISQTQIEAEITADSFAQIAEATRQQIAALGQQSLRGMRFGGFRSGDGYYCNTLEIFAENGDAAFTVMGGVMVRGHLYAVATHTALARTEADFAEWTRKSLGWIEGIVAENRAAIPNTPIIATVANVDDYTLAGMALEKKERVRMKGRGGPDTLDVRVEYPRSMKEVATPKGAIFAVERVVDDYAFRLEVGETRYDAALDAALDAFAAAKDSEAKAMAVMLAPRLANADAGAIGAPGDILATGVLPVAGRNAVWRDTWRPPAPGSQGSGSAVKTVWLQAADCRALKLEFSLRDTRTSLVPVADLSHFNMVMAHAASDISIQDKKQFKKK